MNNKIHEMKKLHDLYCKLHASCGVVGLDVNGGIQVGLPELIELFPSYNVTDFGSEAYPYMVSAEMFGKTFYTICGEKEAELYGIKKAPRDGRPD